MGALKIPKSASKAVLNTSNLVEYRKHYYLDELVIIAPNRKRRPMNTLGDDKKDHQSACQFCNNTEVVTYAWPNKDNWQIKTVKNIYPCVDFDFAKAPGYQEVIIEFPQHKTKISQITKQDLFDVFKVYQDRMRYGLSLEHIKYISIFKNMGLQAGATQEHLHSQMWAVPITPPQILSEVQAIQTYHANNGSCPVCDLIEDEKEHGIRVLENGLSMLLNPYCSRFTYEAWVLPGKHYATLVGIDDDTLKEMARQAYEYLRFIEAKGFDYSLIMHDLQDPLGHFYIKILPRTFPMQIISGVELEAGLNVNVVAPESVKAEYEKF